MKSSLAAVAFTCLGGLVAIAVLAPQVVHERAAVSRADAERRIIETRCTFRVDGSASCGAGTFAVTTTTTTVGER